MRLIKHKFYSTPNASKLKSYFCGIRYSNQVLEKSDDFIEGEHKEVLIVKADSIGDYVMMRNFWEVVKSSPKYKDAKITLILSTAMRGIAEYLDSDVIEKFFYVPHPFWKLSDREKFLVLKKLFQDGLKKQYDTILFPSFNVSNVHSFNMMLASSIATKESIAQIGDSNPNDWGLMDRNRFFTQIVTNLDGCNQFEFTNNKLFFERACECEIDLQMHRIDLPKVLGEKYVVINPNAQDKLRNWHAQNYSRVIQYLVNKYKMKVVLVGAKSEKEVCDNLNRLTEGLCELVVGATFKDLLGIINDAALFIGNDSSCFHMAVSLQTKAICLSGGVSWHRFVNYPVSDLYRIVIDEETRELLERYSNNPQNKYCSCPFVGNVNSVLYSQVKEAIDALLV